MEIKLESSLTKLELDAVYQLIQLSAASEDQIHGSGADSLSQSHEEGTTNHTKEEGSVGEAFSSTAINKRKFEEEDVDDDDDDEPLRRKNRRFRSLRDLYRRTGSPIDNPAKDRSRF